MQRTDSFENTLMLEKIEGKRRGQQRMTLLDGITDSMDVSLSNSWWWTGRPGMLQSTVLQSPTWLSDWTELMMPYKNFQKDGDSIRNVSIFKSKYGIYKQSMYVCVHLWTKLNRDYIYISFPYSSVDKESACNAGDLGSIPGSGRSPGEENDNELQYSCLENPMDRGTWQATVHWVTHKSWTQISD